MNISVLFDAGFLITSHALAAVTAFCLGTFQLIAVKGTAPHRKLGYLWVALMLWTAGTSLFIYEIRLWGPLSPIHLLSLLTLFGLFGGILAIRRKDIRKHRRIMVLLYSGALVAAGFFAFMPGRLMHKVLFGS